LCIYMWELRFHIHWNKKPNLLLSFQWITVAAMTGSLKSQTTVTCQENVMYIVQSKEDKYLYYGLSLCPDWHELGRSFAVFPALVTVFSCCRGLLLLSYTILATQLLSIAAVPATEQWTDFSPLSFLAFAIHGFWLLLTFIVS
jgi:hypothetical protein